MLAFEESANSPRLYGLVLYREDFHYSAKLEILEISQTLTRCMSSLGYLNRFTGFHPGASPGVCLRYCSLSCFVVNHNAGSPSSVYLWYCRFWYMFYHLCSETLNLVGHSFLSVLGYRLVSQSVLVKVSTLDINSIFISFQGKYGSLGFVPIVPTMLGGEKALVREWKVSQIFLL